MIHLDTDDGISHNRRSLKIMKSACFPSIACLALALPVAGFEEILFTADDGLEVTADLYQEHDDLNTPFIVLFHQAGFSRGAYREIAPRLNEMGFNCLAVDQRSGNAANGVTNETAKRARAAGKPTAFVDAVPDMLGAIALARRDYARGAVIGWGSSYSSALIIKLAGDDPMLVDAVLSFSPGEYFSPNDFIRSSASDVNVPIFITSARGEAGGWSQIFEAIPSTQKVSFIPSTSGNHGSRALWNQFSDSESYWTEVEAFLAPWLVSETKPHFQVGPGLAFELTGASGRSMLLQYSDDLREWRPLSAVTLDNEGRYVFTEDATGNPQRYFRAASIETKAVADITNVTASGQENAYSFSVTIQSPETGCDQYADWWEVLSEDGELLYRRILAHSHVNEQPFTRRGGSVRISPNQIVWIRAHMNHSGYGGQAFRGSVAEGFRTADLAPSFAHEVAAEAPLPNGCAF